MHALNASSANSRIVAGSSVPRVTEAAVAPACMRCSAAAACGMVRVPEVGCDSRGRVAAGGYGYLGVCHDSVAIVQAALQQEVTLFPCLLAGEAETIMSQMYKARRPRTSCMPPHCVATGALCIMHVVKLKPRHAVPASTAANTPESMRHPKRRETVPSASHPRAGSYCMHVSQALRRSDVPPQGALTSGSAVQEIHEACMDEGLKEKAAVAEQVKHALLRTPCDVVHEPTSMHDAIRRVAACTPPVTPFVTLERCREDLRRVAAQLDAAGICADKAQHAVSSRAAAMASQVATGASKSSTELQAEATAA